MRYILTTILALLIGGTVTSCVTKHTLLTGVDKEKAKLVFHASFAEFLEQNGNDPLSPNDYDVSFVDLNNDTRLDAVALASLWKTGFAGSGGGTMFIFANTANGNYQFISRNTVTRMPIHVREAQHSGWRDIVVHTSGGGMKAADRLMVFNGKRYPSNPTVEPETTIMKSDVVIMGGGEPHR